MASGTNMTIADGYPCQIPTDWPERASEMPVCMIGSRKYTQKGFERV
jgi:hypothetical protein